MPNYHARYGAVESFCEVCGGPEWSWSDHSIHAKWCDVIKDLRERIKKLEDRLTEGTD